MKVNKLVAGLIAVVVSINVLSISSFAAWESKNGNTYYVDSNGTKVTGWQTIDGNRYLFSSSGEMMTGWVTMQSGNKYYFDDNGKMITGWRVIDGFRYYFDSNGKMCTGKIKIKDNVYDLGTDGIYKNESSYTIMAPFNGLKWGMSRKQVIQTCKISDYKEAENTIYVFQSQNPLKLTYYSFDQKDKLITVGICSFDEQDEKKYRKAFANTKWKLEGTLTDKNNIEAVYSTGDLIVGYFALDEGKGKNMVYTFISHKSLTNRSTSKYYTEYPTIPNFGTVIDSQPVEKSYKDMNKGWTYQYDINKVTAQNVKDYHNLLLAAGFQLVDGDTKAITKNAVYTFLVYKRNDVTVWIGTALGRFYVSVYE